MIRLPVDLQRYSLPEQLARKAIEGKTNESVFRSKKVGNLLNIFAVVVYIFYFLKLFYLKRS